MDSNAFDMLISPICQGLASIFLAAALLRGAGSLAAGLVRGSFRAATGSGTPTR
jgi:hypothetical protein